MPYYLQIICYTGINILSLYTLNSAMSVFLDKDDNVKMFKKMLLYAIYLVAGTFTYIQVRGMIANVVITSLLVYITTFCYKNSINRKIVVTLSWTTFTAVMEILISTLYVFILNQSLSGVILDDTSKLIATIVYRITLLIVIKAIFISRDSIKSSERLSFLDSLYVGAIPMCSIVLLYFLTLIAVIHPISTYIVIVACVLIIFINIFFFILFDQLKIAEKVKYEHELLKNQASYYLKLENHINDTLGKINTIKHNLKYQLLYLKAKTQDNTVEAMGDIKNTLNTLIADTATVEIIEYTKNKKLNRLLNYKLFAIAQTNIPLDIKVTIRDDTYIDEYSLYTILGNVIDNAIRNYDSETATVKDIVIRIFDDCDNLYIKIENPYNKRLRFRDGLPVTDKSDKSQHGVGLKSIRALIKSMNGYFNISTDDAMFTVEILLYDEIKRKK